MTVFPDKTTARGALGPISVDSAKAVQGKIAERLRRLDVYRHAKQVFMDPSLLLRQARINALIDGKELIMPAAGLKEGFYLLKPFSIPFRNLGGAVTYQGLDRYGQKLVFEEISSLEISLMAGEVLAVDSIGMFVADGHGFFDLTAAVFAETGALTDACRAVAVIDDPNRIVDKLPPDPWDIECAFYLTPQTEGKLSDSVVRGKIYWDDLNRDRVRKLSPLFKLQARRKGEDL